MPKALLKALRANVAVDEYIVTERQEQSLSRSLGGKQAQAQVQRRDLAAQVFVDRELGRGQSLFFATPETPLQPLIQQAVLRALRALGPSWRLRPPSAPALVKLADDGWSGNRFQALDLVWEQFQAHLPSGLRVLEGEMQLEFASTRAILSNGFDNHFVTTKLDLWARLQSSGGTPVVLALSTRRLEDVRWQALFEDAERRSLQSTTAVANESGAVDLLLLSSAYLPKHDKDFGLWTPLARQCAASLAASGLARYQVGQDILLNPARGDLLSIRSDGTRPFGLRSAPFDSEGQAVRRFSLVERGKSAGQSIDYRQAARQGLEANGGVRDLVIDSGKQELAELSTPGSRPLLVVSALSDLHTEDRGGLCLRIDSAERRVLDASGSTQSQATRGGLVSGNLYTWLQDARFSSERDDLLWLDGPRAVRFNQLELRS